jgi:O-glycosyl hydrolase
MNMTLPKLAGTLAAIAAAMLSIAPVRAQNVTIEPSQTYQTIDGFGGMNGAGWISDLSPAQVDLAYGSGAGQIGLSIMRMRIAPSNADWNQQVPSAVRAHALGAKLLATPWSPPAYMKSNNSLGNGGKLLKQYYAAYTKHLLDFSNYMSTQGAPLYAISLQNEPDWHPDYESADWNGDDFVNFLNDQGSNFSKLKLVAGESLGFNTTITDPLLNSATAGRYVSIIGGHLYGTHPKEYPLARSKGKQLWMTEHYVDNIDGNAWPDALDVATELHESMLSNYSGYIWWYIRRSYGLISENGMVSKRGYVMAQYARFVRPGAVRIGATAQPYADIVTSAYKSTDGKIVLIAVNTGTHQRQLKVDVKDDRNGDFVKYSTSSSVNVGYGGKYALSGGQASFYVEPQSVTTFVQE